MLLGGRAEQPPTPRLPFFDKFRARTDSLSDGNSLKSPIAPAPVAALMAPPRPASPESESDYGDGLAYAASSSSQGGSTTRGPAGARVSVSSSRSARTERESSVGGRLAYARSESEGSSGSALSPPPGRAPPLPAGKDGVRFPTTAGGEADAALSPRAPARSVSSASAYSGRTASALMKAMEPVVENRDDDDEHTRAHVRSPENRAVRLPTRALTSPASNGQPARKRKEKSCAKCSKLVKDGRWVQTEGGGVLCEKCWKTMYLPKVTSLFPQAIT